MIAGQVVLPELHDRVRLAARSRIGQADRFHRAEPQRVHAARRHDLDRQAALEELRIVEVVQRRLLGGRHGLMKATVFVSGQRTIEVVALTIIDAARRTRRALGLVGIRCSWAAQTSPPT